jgi:hypothetical protein
VPEKRTNLRVLVPSRKKPQAGVVFAMQVAARTYLFGRVIFTEAVWTLAEGADPAILTHFYAEPSEELALPARAQLRPDRLLVSPIMTNRLPWSRGYFKRFAQVPLEPGDVLSQRCILSGAGGRYFDEQGRELPGPVEPVGDYGLHSFRTIDEQISDALGTPRASGSG